MSALVILGSGFDIDLGLKTLVRITPKVIFALSLEINNGAPLKIHSEMRLYNGITMENMSKRQKN